MFYIYTHVHVDDAMLNLHSHMRDVMLNLHLHIGDTMLNLHSHIIWDVKATLIHT